MKLGIELKNIQKYSLYLFPILLVFLFLFLARRPAQNYDMLPYSFLILKLENPGDTNQTIHTKLYEEVAKNNLLTTFTTTSYRKTLFEDWKAFSENLNFYTIRPLYILISFLFYIIGVPLFWASALVSILSYLALFLLLYFALNKIYYNPFLNGSLLLTIIASASRDLYSMSTPDGLSNLLLICLMLSVIKKNHLLVFITSILAIFARHDNIILITLIYLGIFILNRFNPRFLIYLGIIVVTYLGILEASNYPGYATIFSFTLIKIDPYPLTNHLTFNFQQYLNILWMGIRSLEFLQFLFLIMTTAAVLLSFDAKGSNKALLIIFFAIVFSVAIRFILFPVYWERFYFIYFILLLFIIYISVVNKFQNKVYHSQNYPP